MSLRSETHWSWDFWFARDGADVHLFYLTAPQSLGDPELRHQHARIGHAVSRDLVTWTDLGAALPPAPPDALDDLASWTGSVVRDPAGGWRMFYTGLSSHDEGAVQRVIDAWSADLHTWRRGELRLEADPRWYEHQDWRDPWVEWDPGSQVWRMYVCATAADRRGAGPADGRGVVAQLTSVDLDSWVAGPPVATPGEFRQMEVPQIVPCGPRWALLFCANDIDHSTARLARGAAPEYGTHVLYSDSLAGPFELEGDAFLSGDNGPSLYAGRAIEHAGRWWFLAWHRLDDLGAFVGGLSDPFPLDVVDGSLVVDFGARARHRTS